MTAILHAFRDEEAPARRLADALGIDAAFVDTHRFPDGELLPRVPAGAETVLVYRSLDRPNDKLIELMLAAEAWRRNCVRRLVLVAPYLCYMRQDAVFRFGEPVSQRVIGRLLGGVFDRMITVDAHLHRTKSLASVFPEIGCVNLAAATTIADHLKKLGTPSDLIVVGPDIESRPWAEALASRLGVECEVMVKERLGDARVILHPPPSLAISGRSVLIVDDVASSGSTLIEAARLLVSRGARSVDVAVTHALFDEVITTTLHSVGVGKIASSDSCSHSTNAIALAPLLACSLIEEVSA